MKLNYFLKCHICDHAYDSKNRLELHIATKHEGRVSSGFESNVEV